MCQLIVKKLRSRFVSDFNLPINVVLSPYFEDRLELLEDEYKAKTSYNNLITLIDNDFDGSIDKFLTYYSTVRDKIITTVLESEAYNKFISDDKFIKNTTPICATKNLYTHEQDGCMFVSYDMKKANFQTLKYADPSIVMNAETYEEFIGKFTPLDYIKNSKYTRQVIFGKLNPKRTMGLEKWLTNEFAKTFVENDKMELFSINSDEVIFKFNGSEGAFEHLEVGNTKTWNGITFKCEKFKLHARVFELATSSSTLTVYEKEDYLNGHKRHLKATPVVHYAQVYKLLHGMDLTPSDLKFHYEHELCSFDNPLRLIK